MKAGFQFGQNILNALQVAAGIVQAGQGFFFAGSIKANAGGFIEQAAAFFRAQTQGGIHQPLANDGVGAFCQAAL